MNSGTLLMSAVLTLACLASMNADANAQSAPTPEEVQQAQVRWSEGKAAFDAGNYEAARVAFKQAYTIFQHPAFLQNLGEAELRTGRMVEAARHLTLFLRASSAGSPTQREFAKKSLRRAAEKLGSIVVDANVEEAEVRVDGELIGVTPLAGLAWHVAPGVHVVTGHREGFLDGTERVHVAAGAPTPVLVRLQRIVAPATDDAADKATEMAAAAPVQSPAPQRETASGGVEARTVVLLTGTVVTVVAAGLGVGFTMRANDDLAARDQAWRALNDSDVDSKYGCGGLGANEASCQSLANASSRLRTDRLMQFVGFIGAGVIGAGTLATFFIWQPSVTASLIPVMTPSYAGVRWSTAF